MRTYGSAATRRGRYPVNFRCRAPRGPRTPELCTHQLPSIALDTSKLRGWESLALYSRGNIFSSRRERVFTVWCTRKRQKKTHKKKQPKNKNVRRIWQVSECADHLENVWTGEQGCYCAWLEAQNGVKITGCRNTAEEEVKYWHGGCSGVLCGFVHFTSLGRRSHRQEGQLVCIISVRHHWKCPCQGLHHSA